MTTSNKDWENILSPEEYRVMRQKGTEMPYQGVYTDHFQEGDYICKGCGEVLFTSDSKFPTDCGWPGFDQEVAKGKIKEILDKSFGMTRVEVVCANCESHLGHLFNDGPTETGMRYCINSISLDFKKKS